MNDKMKKSTSKKKICGKGNNINKIGPGKDLIAAIYDPKFLKYLQEQAKAKTSTRKRK